jgi:hypothetical protein
LRYSVLNKDDFEDVKEGMKINYEVNQQPKKEAVISNTFLINQVRKVRAVHSIIKFEIEKNDVFELNTAGKFSA